jgi:hypothetical protein
MSNGDFSCYAQLRRLIRLYERHVDGHDYMWAVSEMIDRAKEFIFILVISLHAVPTDHLLTET